MDGNLFFLQKLRSGAAPRLSLAESPCRDMDMGEDTENMDMIRDCKWYTQ